MECAQLDQLVQDLQREFQAGPSGKRVVGLLSAYARGCEDWRSRCFFDPATYTRNLVERNERFELLILGWGAGQESPIHNHEGQDCWMGVLDGDVEEVRYPPPAGVGPGPLPVRDTLTFRRGEVGFIRDDIALHLVRSGRPPESAVSLHLYASPYDECNVYCPDTGKVTRRKLSYYSIRGRVLAPGGAPA
jgi:cysteine dioxygenase